MNTYYEQAELKVVCRDDLTERSQKFLWEEMRLTLLKWPASSEGPWEEAGAMNFTSHSVGNSPGACCQDYAHFDICLWCPCSPPGGMPVAPLKWRIFSVLTEVSLESWPSLWVIHLLFDSMEDDLVWAYLLWQRVQWVRKRDTITCPTTLGGYWDEYWYS